MRKIIFLSLFFVPLLWQSCNYIKEKTKTDKVLANVNDKELRMSSLEGMLPEGTSKEDSVAIISAFVTRWVKDNLMMDDAERNIPKDLEIDRLVREYRASLILNAYQERLVKQSLDTFVTEAALKEFYQNNKAQYELETPLIRCYMLKIPKSAPNTKDVEKWWDDNTKENRAKLTDYASKYAASYMMIDSTWYKAERIALELPKGTINAEDPSTGESTRKDDNFHYFLRVLAVKNKRDYAPFEYVRDQATTFILQQRKQKLVENQRETLFQKEMQANAVKIYTQ
jgi:hypothetical protein